MDTQSEMTNATIAMPNRIHIVSRTFSNSVLRCHHDGYLEKQGIAKIKTELSISNKKEYTNKFDRFS